MAITVQFNELVENQFQIVQRLRPILVSSHLNHLPRRNGCINLFDGIGKFSSHLPNRIFVSRFICREHAVELLLQLKNRFFES